MDTILNEQREGNSTGPLLNYTDMEAEYVALPSRGIFYKGKYKGLDKLKVRKLNWEDEDILTTKSYYDNGTLFTELLKNCIVDENGFKAKDLVAVDRDAILWWLRITAFGPEYTATYQCPNCDRQDEITWNLAEFEMPELSEKYYDELIEHGSVLVDLPVSKLKCRVTIPSVGREEEIAKKLNLKKTKTKSTKDFNITGKLMSVIEEAYDAEGNVYKETGDILNWLRTGFDGKPIPLVDSRTIQLIAREINVKVDTKQDAVCRHCGHVQEGVEMFMSIRFFWPEFGNI
jgi:hypothetical protein